MKRVHICTLFFTFSSCSNASQSWSARVIQSTDCAQLSHPPENKFKNIEICFQKDGCDLKVYLNTYSIPFQKDCDGYSTIILTINDTSTSFKASVLAGNQRILLPTEARDLLLNALNEKKEGTITVGKYFAEIRHGAFEQEYRKFNPL